MKTLVLILVFFTGISFAQENNEKDTLYNFTALLKADWNDVNKDFSFEYNKRTTFKYANLSVHDDNTKLTRKYIYHNGKYDLKSVIPDFERRFFYDGNLPVASDSNALNLGGALFIGLFNTIFQ